MPVAHPGPSACTSSPHASPRAPRMHGAAAGAAQQRRAEGRGADQDGAAQAARRQRPSSEAAAAGCEAWSGRQPSQGTLPLPTLPARRRVRGGGDTAGLSRLLSALRLRPPCIVPQPACHTRRIALSRRGRSGHAPALARTCFEGCIERCCTRGVGERDGARSSGTSSSPLIVEPPHTSCGTMTAREFVGSRGRGSNERTSERAAAADSQARTRGACGDIREEKGCSVRRSERHRAKAVEATTTQKDGMARCCLAVAALLPSSPIITKTSRRRTAQLLLL